MVDLIATPSYARLQASGLHLTVHGGRFVDVREAANGKVLSRIGIFNREISQYEVAKFFDEYYMKRIRTLEAKVAVLASAATTHGGGLSADDIALLRGERA